METDETPEEGGGATAEFLEAGGLRVPTFPGAEGALELAVLSGWTQAELDQFMAEIQEVEEASEAREAELEAMQALTDLVIPTEVLAGALGQLAVTPDPPPDSAA